MESHLFISAGRIALSASLVMNPDHEALWLIGRCAFAALNRLVLPFTEKLEARTTRNVKKQFSAERNVQMQLVSL